MMLKSTVMVLALITQIKDGITTKEQLQPPPACKGTIFLTTGGHDNWRPYNTMPKDGTVIEFVETSFTPWYGITHWVYHVHVLIPKFLGTTKSKFEDRDFPQGAWRDPRFELNGVLDNACLLWRPWRGNKDGLDYVQPEVPQTSWPGFTEKEMHEKDDEIASVPNPPKPKVKK